MRLILGFFHLFFGALIFSTPNMTRRGILFGVPIPPNFRESSMARQSVAIFRALIAGVTVIGLCGLLFSPEILIGPVALAEQVLIFLAGGLGFLWQNHKLRPFAVQVSQLREADLTDVPDRIPWFTSLGAGPFAMIMIAAAFLQSNWESISMRFPVHWGDNGQPNRWQEKSAHSVYCPLVFAAELCAWFLILALAGWFGARRSRLRPTMLGAMIAVEYVVGIMLISASISPVISVPIWVPLLGPMIFVIPMFIVMARKIAEPGGTVEQTPDECWKISMIYYNPSDSALVVEKRTGVGYTLNFGNRWCWVLLLGLGLVFASASVLL